MSTDQSTGNELQSREESERPDEMSGRWIRDQLKDAAGGATPHWLRENPAERSEKTAVAERSPDDPLSPLVANLAQSISLAVAQPLEHFERQRRQEAEATEEKVREHDERITAAFNALRLVEEASRRLSEKVESQERPTRETRELVDRLQGRSEELQSEIRREAEQMASSVGSLRSELEGFAQRLSHVEGTIEQQRATLARLEASERRRGKSLQEMARLMGDVQRVLIPVEPQQNNSGE